MSFYKYEVVNQAGEITVGRLEADSEGAVLEQLQKQGLAVTDIQPEGSSLSKYFKLEKKVKLGDLAVFSRQLASMLQAGIPLVRALYILSKEVTNSTLREAVAVTVRNVEGGTSLSDALRDYPQIFPEMYVNMVASGELGGTLDQVLDNLAEQLEKDKSLRENVVSATRYPTVVLCFAILVLLGMMIFIVPLITKFFPPGFKLPAMTAFVVDFSNSIRHYWYIWIGAVLLLVLLVRTYLHSESGARSWDRVRLRLPIFGPLIHKVIMARFSRTLQAMLASGIPIIQALHAAGGAAGSFLVQQAVVDAGAKIQEGKSISRPLEESGVFTPMVIHMIAVGEESGDLPGLLGRIANYYEAEVAVTTKSLSSMIEPLMIVFVGILVGFMVISLYLPLFMVTTMAAH